MSVSKEIEVDGGLLVGHDGSDFADHALAWALRLADAVGLRITVVRAWVLTTAPRPESWSPAYMPPMEDFEAATLTALRADVDAVRQAYPDVEVHCRTVHGRPAARLVAASERADMIVVGRRGLGGFKGLALGSVSNQVVGHSRGTVVVVNPTEGDNFTPDARLVLDEGVDPEQGR